MRDGMNSNVVPSHLFNTSFSTHHPLLFPIPSQPLLLGLFVFSSSTISPSFSSSSSFSSSFLYFSYFSPQPFSFPSCPPPFSPKWGHTFTQTSTDLPSMHEDPCRCRSHMVTCPCQPLAVWKRVVTSEPCAVE